RSLGLRVRFTHPVASDLSHWQLPVVLSLADGDVAVVTAISNEGTASVLLAGGEGLEQPVPLADLLQQAKYVVLARPARSVPDARVDAYIRPFREDWLRRIIARDWKAYISVLFASLIANSLGLSGIIFSMQV